MPTQTATLQETFKALTQDRQLDIIYHGAALRLNDLQKRYFLAQSKVRVYEDRYQINLSELDTQGLPDNATYEMHEDYIMWHHWTTVAGDTKAEIDHLKPLVEQGWPIREVHDAGN